MSNLLYLGAGVMSSAVSVPPVDNGAKVTLVGSPLDRAIIDRLKRGEIHPKLDKTLSSSVIPIYEEELGSKHFDEADAVLIGANCIGVDWALKKISQANRTPKVLLMITKGLFETESGLLSLPEYIRHKLGEQVADSCFIGIGGPCIARELSNRVPTLTVYGYNQRTPAEKIRSLFQTEYYRISLNEDLQGVEVNAALKNFMTIGISATWTMYPEIRPTPDKPRNMNPTAFCFTQALAEMEILTKWLRGNSDNAYGPAGLGDLFVTVNAGRNSKLGLLLGKGVDFDKAINEELNGETIEGAIVAQNLYRPLNEAIRNGQLPAEKLALTCAILRSVVEKQPYQLNYQQSHF